MSGYAVDVKLEAVSYETGKECADKKGRSRARVVKSEKRWSGFISAE
jgi:hypothetical protein